MFLGDISFKGSPLIFNFIIITTFLSTIIEISQENGNSIFIIDFIQSFFCWNSLNTSILISISLWCVKNIEKILGTYSFLIFLFYNFIIYFPFYLLILFFFGFQIKFPFLIFIPLSLTSFFIWRIPMSKISGFYDKTLILILTYFYLSKFPKIIYFLLILISIGYFLWEKDYFHFQKLLYFNLNEFDNDLRPDLNNNENINILISMGFNREQSEEVLLLHNNNLNEAINHLIHSNI